jgi:DNA-binding NarL/FixJ family response regulator
MNTLADIRLLVIDDDPEILEVLKEWLTLFGAEVDAVSSSLEAVRLAKSNHYDVVVTDLKMPMLNGLQLMTILRTECDPAPQVIFLTGEGSMEDAITALREGQAFDFLLKPIRDYQSLNRSIEKALAQRERLLAVAKAKPKEMPSHVEPLSARENELVVLLAEGLDNREIADRLCLSEKTVKNHLTRIYEKLKVGNRTQAVVSAKSYGLIQ